MTASAAPFSTASATPAGIPIFRAGTHVAADGRRVTFTRDDLREIADSYEPALQRAPHVIGHPELDSPAWGWIKRLAVDGDLLVAVESDQVEANFAQMVNQARFPNRSASFYLPDTPGNPKPGRKYLKHVGWLGAAPPAVAGLPPVKFSADSAKAVSFSLPADFAAVPAPTPTNTEPTDMDKAELDRRNAELNDQATELAKQQAKLAADQQTLAAGQQALAAQQTAEARKDVVQFAQGLEKDGKLLPAETPAVVELLMALPASTAPLSFSQAGTTVSKPAADVLRDLLKALPARIDYSEKSRDQGGAAPLSFSGPRDALVDSTRAELHARVTQYQAAHPGVSFIDAVRACGG